MRVRCRWELNFGPGEGGTGDAGWSCRKELPAERSAARRCWRSGVASLTRSGYERSGASCGNTGKRVGIDSEYKLVCPPCLRVHCLTCAVGLGNAGRDGNTQIMIIRSPHFKFADGLRLPRHDLEAHQFSGGAHSNLKSDPTVTGPDDRDH